MIDRAKQFINNTDAIIFDLDGLLIDSEPIWGKVKIEMVNKFGDPRTAHMKAGTTGMGLRETIVKHKKFHKMRGNVDRLMDEYRKTLYDLLFQDGNLFFMPGAFEFLQTVKGKSLAIATGGHTASKVMEILTKLGIADYFQAVVSCDEVENGKPEPDVYVEAVKRLGKNPAQAIIFEDATNGVMAGKGSGAIVIGVNRDQNEHQDLQDAGADVVIGGMNELI